MKILQVNKYFYVKGGPERYMFGVSKLLRAHGHDIAFFSMNNAKNGFSEWSKYFVHNVDYNKEAGIVNGIRMSKNILYSKESFDKISQLVDEFKPDVAHLHNFNHQLSPSILVALKSKKVPVVMTVHDYKLVCPSYSMLNHGNVCELCRERRFYSCLGTKCHKNSFAKSAVATLESYLHHCIFKSYQHIDRFICPSVFIMKKLQEMGLKGNFSHLANFVDVGKFNPLNHSFEKKTADRFIFLGRLSKEKGVDTLFEAVKGLPVKLDIVGEGPMKKGLEERIRQESINNINLKGYLKTEELMGAVRGSFMGVVPSEWYENNPLSILEAFACGVPVIGTSIGGIPELVKDGETGFLFQLGNVDDLRDKIIRAINSGEEVEKMGERARRMVEEKYSPGTHYGTLIEIYKDAIKSSKEKDEN